LPAESAATDPVSTREAVLPVGGLVTGQEFSAPGRSLSVTARMEF